MSRLNFNLERETVFYNGQSCVFDRIRTCPHNFKWSAYFTNHDPLLSKVYNYVNHGWPNIIKEQLKPFFRCWNDLRWKNLCIQWGGRVIYYLHHYIQKYF